MTLNMATTVAYAAIDYGLGYEFQRPEISAGDAGMVLVAVGWVAGGVNLGERIPRWTFAFKEWKRKRTRTREAMDNRDVQLKDWLGDGITDLFLTAEVNGKISNQESRRLMKEISEKLHLPDLVPTKSRAQQIKQEIKARRAKGLYKEPARIPGPKPGDAVPKTGAVKQFVSKFWRTSSVAS